MKPDGRGQSLTLVEAKDGNAPGTSGSPILTADGRAVGVVAIGNETSSPIGERTVLAEQHGQPMLAMDLPGWLLAEVLNTKRRRVRNPGA